MGSISIVYKVNFNHNKTLKISSRMADTDTGSRRLSFDGSYLYKILEIEKDASDKEIKASYYNLSRKYHPDKNRESENSEENNHKMSEVGKANAVLSDPDQKAVY